MKRTPLKRKTELKRTGAPKPGTGLKRGTTNLKRKRKGVPTSVHQQVLARDGGCVARTLVPEVQCRGRIDPHHALMRSQGGKDTLDDLIAVCRAHHDHIHANPAQSYSLGLLRHPDRSTQ